MNARKSRGGARRLVDIVGRRRALALLTGGDRIGYLADDSAESSASATRKESANISNEESEVTRGERARQMKGDSRLLDWGLADRVTTRGRDGFQEALDLLRYLFFSNLTLLACQNQEHDATCLPLTGPCLKPNQQRRFGPSNVL